MPYNKSHFDISERRVYLRTLDVVFSLLGLYLLNRFFKFDYFDFSSPSIKLWMLILVIYLWIFGEIFELYNLKVSSNRYLTVRSIGITVLFSTIFYFFTPVISPELPENRLQLVYFSMTLFFVILINRLLYIQLIFSPRFLKNILLIAESSQVQELMAIINNKNRFVFSLEPRCHGLRGSQK